MTQAYEKISSYLQANPYSRVRVIYQGKSRTIFYNQSYQQYGILHPGCRHKGQVFYDWGSISAVFIPKERSAEERQAKIVRKYKTEAAKASFSNAFIRSCLNADESKSAYENNLSSGTSIDGKLVSLKSIAKHYPGFMEDWKLALREGVNRIWRFDYNGYDGSVELNFDTGEMRAWFSKEFRGCGNGYYYILVNDDYFIGYDID